MQNKNTQYAIICRDKNLKKLKEMNLENTHNIKLIIPMSKMMKDYKSFDEKKKIAQQYTWLIEENIAPLQDRILGNVWKNATK
jgi:hypothetical protein